MRSEWWSLEQRAAAYHRAAAARARRLRAEATTPWLKEHLEDAIARHERIAAEVESASEPDADEEIELVRRHVDELQSALGELEDAKTLAGLLLFLQARR